MGNLGTGFLRKVSKSEEGLTRISRINVAKSDGKGEKAKRLPHYMSQKDYRKDSDMWLPSQQYEAKLKSVSNIPQCVRQPNAERQPNAVRQPSPNS